MRRQPDPPLAPFARLRWAALRRTVADLRPGTILELGCGLGGFGVRLARLARYTAAEPDDRCWVIARARITPLGGTVLHGNHHQVPAAGGYDLVCAFEVLEHIADDAAALRTWLGLVRPGGHILLTVPAGPDRYGPSDVLAGHYRRYEATALGRLLARAGAVDISVRHYAWPLGYLLNAVRDRMADRRVAGAAVTAEQRTATSGRLFQPRSALVGAVIRAGVAPFAALQRLRPGTGPGLVALARRPASG